MTDHTSAVILDNLALSNFTERNVREPYRGRVYSRVEFSTEVIRRENETKITENYGSVYTSISRSLICYLAISLERLKGFARAALITPDMHPRRTYLLPPPLSIYRLLLRRCSRMFPNDAEIYIKKVSYLAFGDRAPVAARYRTWSSLPSRASRRIIYCSTSDEITAPTPGFP